MTALWVVPMVAVALWWMIHALRRGSYLTFIVEAMVVGGIVYFGVGHRLLRRASAAQRWRAWSEVRGTVIRANPLQAAGYTVALLAVTVGILGLGALAVTGTLDYPLIGEFSRSDRRMLGEFAVAGLIAAPLVLWLAGTLLWTRGPGGELVLGPGGVSVRPDRTLAPLGPAGTLNWAQIAQAEISPIAAPRRRGRMDFVVARAGSALSIPLDLYPDPPETLVRLVRFYQRNPQHRCELGDERAADRLRRGDFGAGADSA